MYPNAHCSTIYNSQDMEATYKSVDEWINTLWCIYTMELLFSHKKERIWVSSSEADEPTAGYTEWRKSEREKQTLYINTHIWNL